MIKTFTQHDLIRYLYRETTVKEEREISKALICDTELQAMYMELCDMKKKFDTAQLEPSSTTVLNILSYSRSTVKEQQSK